MKLSIIIPVYNEREALPELLDEVEAACAALGSSYEILFVDDGSEDGTSEYLEGAARERSGVRVITLRGNFGKSAALDVGFARTRGDVVVTLDGDGQDDPAEIPALIGRLDDGFDLVCGWKRERRDPLSRRVASRIYNWISSRTAGVRLHDMNCGLKAYRGECARSLEIYGELHRYIPVLAAQRGWRVTELAVRHRPRRHGHSKFGSERYLRGALDLLTVTFMGRYQHRPLHLFGGIGLLLMVAGVVILGYLTALKIAGESIGERPLLFLGVLLVVVGIQLLTLGLLGQMLAQMRRESGSALLDEAIVEREIGGVISPADPEPDRVRSATETPPSG